MEIDELLQRYHDELPEQMRLLRKEGGDINDLQSYERRMKDGFEHLLALNPTKRATIQRIREPSPAMLHENSERYRNALKLYRAKIGVSYAKEQHEGLMKTLKALPLMHASRATAALRSHGIHPASELWMSPHKSTANPMDIALGLDRYCFCSHGFALSNFGEDSVYINSSLIDLPTTIVSTVDIFKLVLIATGKSIPCAIPTEQWTSSLEEYSRQLFVGSDFWNLKADYILTFFAGNTDAYHRFAARHFYENTSECAPDGEQPFLGEVKVLGVIVSDLLLSV